MSFPYRREDFQPERPFIPKNMQCSDFKDAAPDELTPCEILAVIYFIQLFGVPLTLMHYVGVL